MAIAGHGRGRGAARPHLASGMVGPRSGGGRLAVCAQHLLGIARRPCAAGFSGVAPSSGCAHLPARATAHVGTDATVRGEGGHRRARPLPRTRASRGVGFLGGTWRARAAFIAQRVSRTDPRHRSTRSDRRFIDALGPARRAAAEHLPDRGRGAASQPRTPGLGVTHVGFAGGLQWRARSPRVHAVGRPCPGVCPPYQYRPPPGAEGQPPIAVVGQARSVAVHGLRPF